MLILLLLISFISLYFVVGIALKSENSKKEIFIYTILIFSTFIIFITEFLSLFHVLNFYFISIFWVFFSSVNIVYLYFIKKKLLIFLFDIRIKVITFKNNLKGYDKLIFGTLCLLMGLVFIQGVIYPPNNVDSLVYHLARIPNWISHQSVEHYPSHTFRQIYQPPFSEYVILNFNILNRGDYYSNSVQFIYLLATIVLIVSFTKLFGLNRKYQYIGLILVLTIPEVLLEASSTQNDIVVSFFIVSFAYFSIKAIKVSNFKNYIFLGLSIGIAILTKGTAYIFLAPIILCFGFASLVKLFQSKNYRLLAYSFVSILIFLLINSGHFYRNYMLTKDILGVDKTESELYKNEKMSPKLLASSILKNIGNHIGPGPISKVSNSTIRKIHVILNIDIDEPGNNIFRYKYWGAPYFPNHEDDSPNLIHLILIFISLPILFINRSKNKEYNILILYYILVIALQLLLFCFYLKWQPWHSRLHTTFFIMSIPLLCFALSNSKTFYVILNKGIFFIIFYSYLIVLFNTTRPYLTCKYTHPISISDDRYKKYFVNDLKNYIEYKNISETINKLNLNEIGLVFGYINYEYTLFNEIYRKDVNPIHLNVTNNPSKYAINKNSRIDCIISTIQNDSIIIYKKNKFYNQNMKNKYIWLYTKYKY